MSPASSARVLSASLVTAPDAAPTHWLFVLHGIYGRGRNWTTIAKALAGRRPEWGSVLVDLRNHGDSPDFGPPHTVEQAGRDVMDLEAARHLHASAMLGHSFGGKVVLWHASQRTDALEQIWIVDSTPETRAASGSAWRMIETVRALPTDFASRTDAVDALMRKGYVKSVAAWMASNLEFRDGRYRWRLDFDVMETLLHDFFTRDLWAVVEEPPESLTIHFVKATESTTLSAEACTRIEAAGRRTGRVFLHHVGGGHWLNADNPQALIELFAADLPAVTPASAISPSS